MRGQIDLRRGRKPPGARCGYAASALGLETSENWPLSWKPQNHSLALQTWSHT